MAVAIAFAVVNSLLLLAIVGLARRAWRTLAPGAQFPVHGGLSGWDRWWPKERALFIWLFAGAAVWLATIVDMIITVTDTGARSTGGTTVLPAILAIPLVFFLVTEHFALKAARAVDDPTGSGSQPA